MTPTSNSKPAEPSHYIAMAGLHGCLPDFCQSFETYQDAVRCLAEIFGLGRTRKAALKRDGYLEVNLFHDYIEIKACDCDDPSVHDDN